MLDILDNILRRIICNENKYFYINFNVFFSITYANDGAVIYNIYSGTVVPVINNHIKLVNEKIFFKDNKFVVEFVFKNTTNKKQIVDLGFPVYGDVDLSGIIVLSQIDPDLIKPDLLEERKRKYGFILSEEDRLKKIKEYYNFKCFIDDKEIERKLAKIDGKYKNTDYKYFFVSTVEFLPNETKHIVNKYNQQPIRHEVSIGDRIDTIRYILETGSSWKEKIDKIEIQFYIPSIYYAEKKLVGWDRDFETYLNISPEPDNVYLENYYAVFNWKLLNIDPDFNISFEYGRTESSPFYGWNLSDIITLISIINKKCKLDYTVFDDSYCFDPEDHIKEVKNILNNRDRMFSMLKYLNAYLSQHFIELKTELAENKYIKDKYEHIITLTQFVINTIYALTGYSFLEEKWYSFFKQLDWYKPLNNKIELNEEELNIIKNLEFIENECKSEVINLTQKPKYEFKFDKHINLPYSTSQYPDNKWGNYSPKNAFDGNIETAWVEGVDGSGIYESIFFIIPINANFIKVLPGYGIESVFKTNYRVKEANLHIYHVNYTNRVKDYKYVNTQILVFSDEMRFHRYILKSREKKPQGDFNTIVGVFEIIDVFKGKDADTCIAEIQFE